MRVAAGEAEAEDAQRRARRRCVRGHGVLAVGPAGAGSNDLERVPQDLACPSVAGAGERGREPGDGRRGFEAQGVEDAVAAMTSLVEGRAGSPRCVLRAGASGPTARAASSARVRAVISRSFSM